MTQCVPVHCASHPGTLICSIDVNCFLYSFVLLDSILIIDLNNFELLLMFIRYNIYVMFTILFQYVTMITFHM